jgi:KaiC/GvpD/RAD55 family RecA-like ATPase
LRKIKSGVFGLNELMDGGIIEHSTTVVVGSPGAGKTTFATQFLRRGLERGEDAVFITLDEAPSENIKNAKLMGWEDVEEALESGNLVFVDAGGKQFSNFIQKELGELVGEWEGHSARIVIDPLTPVLWSVREKYEQRELVAYLLRETRKIGTVLCTLEEHGMMGDVVHPEMIIPMYLADNVVHLRYQSHAIPERRDLKIIKCRSSKHSRQWHPYGILKGAGLYIQRQEDTGGPPKVPKLDAEFKRKLDALKTTPVSGLTTVEMNSIYRTLETLSSEEFRGIDPSELLALILEEYDIHG